MISKKTKFEKWLRDNKEKNEERIARMKKEGLNPREIDFNLALIFNMQEG
ncbi:unnamed protein product [marine sediment metagenome]|uniref:Uncharacterized protein n=1 Tax=marine sediment metagenome TaxID=412755 RepID=X1G9E2_9ZZZZ